MYLGFFCPTNQVNERKTDFGPRMNLNLVFSLPSYVNMNRIPFPRFFTCNKWRHLPCGIMIDKEVFKTSSTESIIYI